MIVGYGIGLVFGVVIGALVASGLEWKWPW